MAPPPAEGPRHEAAVVEPEDRDRRVQARLFVGLAVFFVVTAVLYRLTSSENAGTTMLVLSGGFGALAGGYLWVQGRKPLTAPGGPGTEAEAEAEAEEPYLPHASVWPLGVGTGAFLVANGLILGIWFLVPGTLLLGVSVIGYCLQSRRRD